MEKVSFCFIVLHYVSVEDTCRCVGSILKIKKGYRIHIVVVDNGCGLTRDVFGNDGDCVDIVALSENKGFSAANNIGYRYAAEHYDSDFCIVANNDIIFSQSDFLDQILQEYEYSGFYVLGPDIVVPRLNWHQSPLALSCMNREEAEARAAKLEADKKHYIRHFIADKAFMWIHNILCRSGFLIKIKKRISAGKLPIYTNRYEGACMMGACLIFSPMFVRENVRPFYPETFLYFEEDILAYNCKKNNWKTVYSPKLTVLHNFSASTKKSITHALARNRKVTERMCDAVKVYKEHCR